MKKLGVFFILTILFIISIRAQTQANESCGLFPIRQNDAYINSKGEFVWQPTK
ncbi:MAG TPA: hypothetical protein VGC76_01465 [Pyrinomonadaceae bacterium]